MPKIIAPHIYARFQCIASACRHTCCVGWEIDIDPVTLAHYDALPGHLGDDLRASIDRSSGVTPCFHLTPDERCPHLRDDGLCRIIAELGEEALCGICRDHPRYRNRLPDGTIELGLGLCCEAACALILDETVPLCMTPLSAKAAQRELAIAVAMEDADAGLDAEDSAFLTAMRHLRDGALTVLADAPSLEAVLEALADMVGGFSLPDMQASDWADFLSTLERLDPAWDVCLDALSRLEDGDIGEDILRGMTELPPDHDRPWRNLLGYFLCRYMTSRVALLYGSCALPVSFAVTATTLIYAMVGKSGMDIREVARMFSAEIEYSEDNRDALWDILADAVV